MRTTSVFAAGSAGVICGARSTGGLLSASSGILSAVTSAAMVCTGAVPGAEPWTTPDSNVPASIRGASPAAGADSACAPVSGGSAAAGASAAASCGVIAFAGSSAASGGSDSASPSKAASGGGIVLAGSSAAIPSAGSGPGSSTGATEASACRADAVSAGTCARGRCPAIWTGSWSRSTFSPGASRLSDSTVGPNHGSAPMRRPAPLRAGSCSGSGNSESPVSWSCRAVQAPGPRRAERPAPPPSPGRRTQHFPLPSSAAQCDAEG